MERLVEPGVDAAAAARRVRAATTCRRRAWDGQRVSPVVPPAGAEVVPAGTAGRGDALGGVSAVTVPDLRGQSVRMPRRACVPRSLPNPRSPHASPAPGPVARKRSGKEATDDPNPVDRWTLGPGSCERGRGTLVLDAPEVSGGPATVAA